MNFVFLVKKTFNSSILFVNAYIYKRLTKSGKISYLSNIMSGIKNNVIIQVKINKLIKEIYRTY